jgi:hypothetical protein
MTCDTGYDGTNLYKLVTLPPMPPFSNREEVITRRGTVVVGQVAPGHPSFGSRLIWAAYASGCYFSFATNTTVAAIWSVRPNRGMHTNGDLDEIEFFPEVKATWTLSTGPSQLPREITYYGTRSADAQKSVYPTETDPSALYSATFTNFGPLELPLTFTAARFMRDLASATNLATFPVSTAEGVSERIIHSCETRSFRPQIDGPAIISDLRLRSENISDVKRYIVTNGEWGVVSYAELKKFYTAQKSQQSQRAYQNQRKLPIVFCLMFLASLLTAVALKRLSAKPATG